MKKVVEPAHSKLGASNAERWSNCPGSVALCAAVPALPSSVHAVAGTVAHGLAERLLLGRITTKELLSMVGDEIQEQGFSVGVDDEMVDAVIQYADIIASDGKDEEWAKDNAVIGVVESKVHATTVDAEVYGTADYVMYQPGGRLVVYDFKYGRKPVDAKENKQMGLYAIATMDTLKQYDFKSVELVIVQPRAGGVKRWAVPKGWLSKFAKEMKAAAAATRQKEAPVVAGSWCRWCPAEASCPTKYKEIQKQAAVDFTAIAPLPGLPDVSLLPMEKLVLALNWEDNINSWYEAIKLRIRAALDAGESVPGYKLVDGKTNRQWKDEASVVAAFSGVLGEEQMFEKKLLSPAKLEKIVGKKAVEEWTFKPEGKKAIARSDDPRPAARNTALTDFAPITKVLVEGVDYQTSKPGKSAMAPLTEITKGRDPIWPV
jgi:hypothetical protein